MFLDLKKETNTVCNWFVIRPLRQRQVRGDLLLRVWGSLEICRRLAKLFQGLWQVFAFSFLQNTDKKCLQSAGFVKEEMTNKRCFPQGQVRNDKPIRVARSPHHFRLQPESWGAQTVPAVYLKIPAPLCAPRCIQVFYQVYRLLLRKFDRTGRHAVCFDDFIQCCLVMQVPYSLAINGRKRPRLWLFTNICTSSAND